MRRWTVKGEIEGAKTQKFLLSIIADDYLEPRDIETMVYSRYRGQGLLRFSMECENCTSLILMGKELDEFLDSLNADGLAQELELIPTLSQSNVPGQKAYNYPHFLEGILRAMKSSGYDPAWVDGEFKQALDRKYLPDMAPFTCAFSYQESIYLNNNKIWTGSLLGDDFGESAMAAFLERSCHPDWKLVIHDAASNSGAIEVKVPFSKMPAAVGYICRNYGANAARNIRFLSEYQELKQYVISMDLEPGKLSVPGIYCFKDDSLRELT